MASPSTTLVQLRTKIYDWTGTDTNRVAASVLTEIVNRSVNDFVRRFDTFAAYAAKAIPTADGTRSYDLADFAVTAGQMSRPFLVRITNSTTGRFEQLEEITFEEYVANIGAGTQTKGVPTQFVFIGDGSSPDSQIGLIPVPNGIYTVVVEAFGYPAALSSDSDHNKITDRYPDAVFYRALVLTCEYTRDLDMIPYYLEELRRIETDISIEIERHRRGASKLDTQEP